MIPRRPSERWHDTPTEGLKSSKTCLVGAALVAALGNRKGCPYVAYAARLVRLPGLIAGTPDRQRGQSEGL